MRSFLVGILLSLSVFAQKIPNKISPTPGDAVLVGVLAITQDGKLVVIPTGSRLRLVAGKLEVIMPMHHVGPATFDASDNTWKYPSIGTGVQVWRNGLLQKRGKDYVLASGKPKIVPKHFKEPLGSKDAWDPEDDVVVATLY